MRGLSLYFPLRMRLAMVLLAAVLAWGAVADAPLTPTSGYVDGGVQVTFAGFYPDSEVLYTPIVHFGDSLARDAHYVVQVFRDPNDDHEFYYAYLTCITPAQQAGGPVDVRVENEPSSPGESVPPPVVYPGAFTYLNAPAPVAISPNQHSYKPDDVIVTITGEGFSVLPGVTVLFGDRLASNVGVNSTGQILTCLPPPFRPQSEFPYVVDVHVINPDGKDGVIFGEYTYGPVTPVISRIDYGAFSWSIGECVGIKVDHLVNGPLQIYFDGVPCTTQILSRDPSVVLCILNAHPPGPVPVMIRNGDGGTYVRENAFYFYGEAGTDFHTADQDLDYRISLSELLRVIQYYNSGGLHCDPETEDGYAPGAGDKTCVRHASDHDPKNWKIDLSEVLELIQFYNLYCYQPCPDAPGTYCPPSVGSC